MSAISNLNYIKRVYNHPCATPTPNVMIETAFPAARLALLEVLSFGCTDILKMRLGRTPWHSRGLKMLIRKKSLGVQLGPRTTGFSYAFAPVEFVLQYMLFADAATGFAANWMSLVYQQQGCTLPGSGYIGCAIHSTFQDAGGPYGTLLETREEKQCCSVGGNIIQIPAGCEATISYQTTFKPFLDLPANLGAVRTWLERADGLKFNVQDGMMSPDGKSMTTGGGGHFGAPAIGLGESYKIMWSSSGGLMGCVDGHLSVSSYGRKMPLIPTGCSPRKFIAPYPHNEELDNKPEYLWGIVKVPDNKHPPPKQRRPKLIHHDSSRKPKKQPQPPKPRNRRPGKGPGHGNKYKPK
jgi:hypothetical protein